MNHKIVLPSIESSLLHKNTSFTNSNLVLWPKLHFRAILYYQPTSRQIREIATEHAKIRRGLTTGTDLKAPGISSGEIGGNGSKCNQFRLEEEIVNYFDH